MNNQNEMDLENMISALISSRFMDVPPTEAEFNETAERIRNANSSFIPVSDEEFNNLKKRLREKIVVTMDTGVCLQDLNNGHKSWLPAKRADIDFYYWERYKQYLEKIKHWNPRVTSKLGQVSDEILDQCGDPSGSDFHIRGLVLGDVQSGKTSNYTALANKVADVGYDLVIVLAGIPELLRQQTQKRLDKEFCGRPSNLYLDPRSTIKYVPVGVGRYGNNKKTIACFTSEANDFDAGVLKSNGLALDNVNSTILIVVKKNVTILNNLFVWLKHNNPLNANGQIAKSLFLIDDEADNASINTKNSESDPTAINNAIRLLLSIFAKTTYLAVTATPFANIFINPVQGNDLIIRTKEGAIENTISNVPDLFPADFIYVLDPPTNYIGAERIFSDSGDQKHMLRKIDSGEFLKVFPERHKKDLIVKDLPTDLYEAAYYFLLTNAIRDVRGDNKEHRSMMIHVSRFILVQNQIAEILNAWLDQVKSDLRNYCALPIKKAEEINSIKELHQIWDKYDLENVAGVDWGFVLKNYLYRAVAPVDVRAVNGETGATSLDYDNHKDDGLRVIAVGGNTLSRGLTLEGLMVTYFYRNTNMYDTLMQMGRWFGYRPNYDDLVKIWLSVDAIDWYGQIQEATQDLKDQIYKMRAAKLSPRDFGLKVRQDPGSLIVTARNKMRSAMTIKCPVSVSGHLLETPRLVASLEVINENAEIVEKFIDRLSYEGKRVPEIEYKAHNNYFWEGVSKESVSELLGNFTTHPWHMSYNGKALADYVAKLSWKNGWDVVLIKNGDGGPFYKKIKCGDEYLEIPATERRKIQQSDKVFSVSGNKLRVGAGGCARIGLNKEQVEEAKEQFYANYTGKRNKPTLPDSAYLIKGRNPILMLHILDADYDKPNSKYPRFLYGLGVGIPADEHGNEVAMYQVNLVEIANWMDLREEEDE